MTYFKAGLTKDELLAEYRTLAKQYHPDVCKDPNANSIMAAINEEYDTYFVSIQKSAFGFDWDDLFQRYRQAAESRAQVLKFLRFDKKTGSGWFYTEKGWFGYEHKYKSDNNIAWQRFHGGFKLIHLTSNTVEEDLSTVQLFSPVPARIECPTLQDMYFAMKGQSGNAYSTNIATEADAKRQSAYVSKYGSYMHIRTKKHGEMWIDNIWKIGAKVTAYMKVNGLVMSAEVPGKILDGMETINEYDGSDFGFFEFQQCSHSEFKRTHDVEYTPQYSEALNCRRLNKSDLNWIDDPIVAHFARLGVLKFYEAWTNFRMRYGTFDESKLEEHLHELSIEDAEHIQDFLDNLNQEFEDYIERLIKKGKLHLKI